MKTHNRIKKVIYKIIPSVLIPILLSLSIISSHSTKLIIFPINYIIYFLLIFELVLLLIGQIKYKNINTNIIFKILIFLNYCVCFYFLNLLYGPNDNFRSWYVSTAYSTSNHKYYSEWFYNENEIKNILNNNYIIEPKEQINLDLINFNTSNEYKNKYEKQILKRNKNQKYKIINLKVNHKNAYLAVIYDPSKLHVATSENVGMYGQYATEIAESNNAILAINGGGFENKIGDISGGIPVGVTISNKNIITDIKNYYNDKTKNIIGLTNDNKLILIKDINAKTALNMGIRDSVSMGPFLIINGKKAVIKGNGGKGYAARTAIGQRKDGIILLLVIDSNSTRTKGATLKDILKIMSNYGAINAANLDGGASSVMILPKKEAIKYNKKCNKKYCYINDPVDSSFRHRTRQIATSIILSE